MGKGSLEYFEVKEKIDFKVGLPLDLPKRNLSRKSSVQQLTVDIASPKLFNFGEMSDDKMVGPLNKARA